MVVSCLLGGTNHGLGGYIKAFPVNTVTAALEHLTDNPDGHTSLEKHCCDGGIRHTTGGSTRCLHQVTTTVALVGSVRHQWPTKTVTCALCAETSQVLDVPIGY
jgi:hypothetical protein